MTQDSSIEEIAVESENSSGFARSFHMRTALAVYGILGSIAGHLIKPHESIYSIRSQPSELSLDMNHVLTFECGWPIFPFLIFAMTCLALVIQNTTWAISKPWVRFGIVSGVIVSGWYTVAFSWAVLNTPWIALFLIIGAVFWVYLAHGIILYLTTPQTSEGTKLCILIMLIAIFMAGLPHGLVPSLLAFTLPLFMPLAFLTYVGVSIRVLEQHTPSRRFTMGQLMIWVTWLTALMAGVRTTIELSAAKHAHYF